MLHEAGADIIPANQRIGVGLSMSANQMGPHDNRPLWSGLDPYSVLGDLELHERTELGIEKPRTLDYLAAYETAKPYIEKVAPHGGVKLSFEQAELQRTPRGVLNPEVRDFYMDQFRLVRDTGMLNASVFGLHHFEWPLWVHEMGGMSNRKVAEFFAEYVLKLCGEMVPQTPRGQHINLMVFNEHMTELLARADDQFPPSQLKFRHKTKPYQAVQQVVEDLTVTTGNMAYCVQLIKQKLKEKSWDKTVTLGIGIQPVPLVGMHPFDVREQSWVALNNWLLNVAPLNLLVQTRRSLDWVGLQPYRQEWARYSPELIPPHGKEGGKKNTYKGRSGLHIELVPNDNPDIDNGWRRDVSFLNTLIWDLSIRLNGLPIKITEVGLPATSREKAYHLVDLYESIAKFNANAVERGVAPIQGFLHWTLAETAEWNSSDKNPRFGLLRGDNTERKIMELFKLFFGDAPLIRSEVQACLEKVTQDAGAAGRLTARIFNAPRVVFQRA